MDYTESFLINTASDYDCDIEVVKQFAEKSETSTEFYELIEDFINIRGSSCNN